MDEDLKRIANRIRSWRDEADLTLQQLGDRSGVSASTIHKIENQQTVPTIAILLKVATGLNRRPSELLADEGPLEQVGVLRADGHCTVALNENITLEHLIEMIPNSRLDAWRIQVKAGTSVRHTGQGAFGPASEIILLIEEGCLEGEIGSESIKVEAGDSIHFESNASHRWIAGGGMPLSVLFLAMLPVRLQGDLMSRLAAATNKASRNESAAGD